MNKEKKVYIVLQSTHVGGAERRFIELWAYYQVEKRHNIYLIISKMLFDILSKDILELRVNSTNLIIIDNKSGRSREFFIKAMPIIVGASKNSIFHYPLLGIPMVHNLLGQKMIISMVNSTFYEKQSTINLKGKFLFAMNSIFASKIDVLNPKIYKRFCRYPFVKDKLFLTNGSMVKSTGKIFKKRKNKIVFLGRFDKNDIKNVLVYAQMIPKINIYLSSHGIENIEYYILGHGILEKQLDTILGGQDFSGLNVKAYFETDPEHILKEAKVMLSIQKYENYPSRSLIESMSLGVIPIVTDVGESKLFENEDIIQYIDGNLDVQSLSLAILNILRLTEEEYYARSLILQNFIKEKHSVEAQAKYFLDLYGLSDEK